MEYLEGWIFLDNKLPGIIPARRKSIYQATVRALASLHKVDVDFIGLQKFGRRENYCKRQVERWEKQHLDSTGEGKPDQNPKMLDLAGWLKQHIPHEDSSTASGTGLVHGDFRIDNLVFHPVKDQVIGILDWELSTLGNQMCDVAYSSLEKPWPAASWKFYVAFSLFRGASIHAGVYHKWTLGNASGGERARYSGKMANILIDYAWGFINRKSVLPSQPP